MSGDTVVSAAAPVTAGSGLRANRDFLVVLAGQAVSALGDAITLTALPLLVLSLTGSAALMGLIVAVQLLPDLVIGLVAGALADRWDRRRTMLWTDIGRAVITMAIPIVVWIDGPAIAVIVLAVLPINALRVLSDTAFGAAVPALAGRENLARANSLRETALSIPFIVGPALGGVFAATIGPATAIAVDAATFAVSALCLTFVRSLRPARAGVLPNVLNDIRDGVAFVWRHALIRVLIAFWTMLQVATAAVVPLLALYVAVEHGLGYELFGIIGSAWSIGYLVGSIVVGRMGNERVGTRIAGGGALIGLAVASMATTAWPPILIGAAFVTGALLAVVFVSALTLRLAATPDELLGRVGSAGRTVVFGAQFVALIVVGVVADAVGAAVVIASIGGLALVASLAFGLTRTLREAAVAVPVGAE